MKNNQLAGMLLGLLFLSTLASALLIYKYDASLHRLQRLQADVFAANNTRNVMQALLNDANEYSKTHPDMKPLIAPYIAPRPAGSATAPAKPAK